MKELCQTPSASWNTSGPLGPAPPSGRSLKPPSSHDQLALATKFGPKTCESSPFQIVVGPVWSHVDGWGRVGEAFRPSLILSPRKKKSVKLFDSTALRFSLPAKSSSVVRSVLWVPSALVPTILLICCLP